MANLKVHKASKRLTREPIQAVAGLFGIIQQRRHRGKVFGRPVADFASRAQWVICRIAYGAASPGSKRLIVLPLGEPFGDHRLRDGERLVEHIGADHPVGAEMADVVP